MADQIIELFLARQQYIGGKVETDRGVAATLADADFNILAENLKMKVTIKENPRKYAVGDPWSFLSVMGAQQGEISFSIHVQGSGGAGDPVHYKLLSVSGFLLSATTLFRAAIMNLPNKTMTFYFQQKENVASSIRGKQYKMKGAAASKCVEHYDGSGQLQRIDFTFIGALTAVTDLGAGLNNVPVLTGDAVPPAAVLGITSTYGSLTLPTNAVSIDYGLKTTLIEYPPDATGFAYAVITDLDPIINLKVLIQREATLGIYAGLATGTPLVDTFTTSLGSGAGKEIDIVIPQGQVVKGLDVEARDGIDEQSLMIRATRNTTAIHGFTVPILARFMYLT